MSFMRRRDPTRTIKFLTIDEIGRLFKAIGDDKRNRALFLLAYRHGLRASEVGLLRKEDLDLKALRVVLHRLKGGHSGTHPLQPDEVKAVKLYLRSRDDLTDSVSEPPGRTDLATHAGLAYER
jgi:integrase